MIRPRTQIGALVVSAALLVGLAVKEVYVGDAYIPVPGDVPTIGYGTTEGVKMGQKTTPERALVRLLADADKYANGVKNCITTPLYQHEFDAYVSLAYNVGSAAVCQSSIPEKLSAGKYAEACGTILDFDGQCIKRVAGRCVEKRVLRGLTIRRQAEYKACMGENA